MRLTNNLTEFIEKRSDLDAAMRELRDAERKVRNEKSYLRHMLEGAGGGLLGGGALGGLYGLGMSRVADLAGAKVQDKFNTGLPFQVFTGLGGGLAGAGLGAAAGALEKFLGGVSQKAKDKQDKKNIETMQMIIGDNDMSEEQLLNLLPVVREAMQKQVKGRKMQLRGLRQL